MGLILPQTAANAILPPLSEFLAHWWRMNRLTLQATSCITICFAEFRNRGSSARLSYFRSVFADGCRKLGKIEEGLAAVEE